MKRRSPLRRAVTVLAIALGMATPVCAQEVYPARPIRLVTPFPPGGTTDILARLIGQKLTEGFGKPVVIENRGGGNTIIGTDFVAKARPDGYTLILVSNAVVILPNMRSTPYDPIKDFAAVATIASSEHALVVHPSVPAKNLKQFIDFAKSRPGQLNYAGPGNGTGAHLASENFNLVTGARVQQISYQGTAPCIVAVIAGHVEMTFATVIASLPHVKSGRLRAMAVTGDTRSPVIPDVPTFDQAGQSGFGSFRNWFGILAPAGTPAEIVNKLSAEIAKILAMPDIKQKLAEQGATVFISSPDEFAAKMKSDLAMYGEITKAAHLKME